MMVSTDNVLVIGQWWGWLVGLVALIILVWLAVWITSGNRRFHRNYNSAMKLLTDKRRPWPNHRRGIP